MVTLVLIIVFAVLLVSFAKSFKNDRAWQDIHSASLEHVKALRNALIDEQQKVIDQLQETISMRVKYGQMQTTLEEMEKGRAFDQELLKQNIERAERFKRVLEAVLRSQGCNDERIAYVLAQTEADLDVNES